MRLLLFLSAALFACAAPALAQEPSYKELMGLKGPVKTVRTKSVEEPKTEGARSAKRQTSTATASAG